MRRKQIKRHLHYLKAMAVMLALLLAGVGALLMIVPRAGVAVIQSDPESRPQRGGMLDLLPLLLGGNSAGITSAVSQSTGVSNNSVNSILKIAAPILLYMLLKDDNAPQQQGGGALNLLGALLGGGQQPQQNTTPNLLGALLGGGQQQVQQPQQNAGMNLLGALLGGQQQAQPQQPQQSGLLDLFGGQQQAQPQQSQPQSGGADLLGTLFSILGDTGK